MSQAASTSTSGNVTFGNVGEGVPPWVIAVAIAAAALVALLWLKKKN